MKRIVWERDAFDDLQAIPSPADAAIVDAAVQRFARDGTGFLRHVARANVPDEQRLYVSGAPYYVRLRFDENAVYVWRVIRRP